MIKFVKSFMNKYIFTDELTFDARVFNLVCVVGIFALLTSAIGHIIEHSHLLMMIVKFIMILSAALLLYLCNKYNIHKYGRIAVILGFCDVLFPLVFLANGGSNGGMAAYYVLTMILIFLLSEGSAFFIFMGIHLIIIVSCYLLDRYHNSFIIPLDVFQHYADNIISIVVSGLFIGLITKGVYALFRREQIKSEAASKAKGDFLAQMSHEMRTPMNAILGMTTILENSDDLELHKTNVQKIQMASTQLLGVINDILDMSKIEANKLELSQESFDFTKMIDNIMTVMNYDINAKQQHFTLDIDSAIPQYLIGDKQRLAQVITNLLSNAIKFTPQEGSISLNAHLTGQNDEFCAIRISIADTGIGITEEQMPRLFHTFEQADNSTSRRFGGTGLGLTISKQIVELMGGSIWAISTPNEGSTFTVDIHLQVGECPLEEILIEDMDIHDFTNKKILLAEDVEINREIVAALLEPTHVTIEYAENGKEAVEMFEASNGTYDLIFMDIRMPEMDGYEATKEIRASQSKDAKQIPIIAMTANVFKDDIAQAILSGMNDHLGKPIDIHEVMSKLEIYLG
ncbi:MAG: response regulator [Clostridiales Family XIII bacterium]|jgi:signal transduction histidine kinase/ActR/RegA family two-component response regulator|nr:response regulator [Clostridiales Family XIII bacterium]